MIKVEEGFKPDLEAINNIVIQNALNEEEKNKSLTLYRKYPGYPDDKQIYFIQSILDNPKHREKAETIAKQELTDYKNL